MNIFFPLLTLTILFTSCVSNDNKNSISTDAIADTVKPIKQIDHFLVFKKGMNIEEVEELLNLKAIEHSLKKNIDTNNNDEMSLWYEYPKIKYIDVYNYKLENLTIDNFRLYFIENRLYKLRYYKNINSSGEESIGEVIDFANKHRNVVSTIYNGLIEKYGMPDKLDSPSDSKEDSLASSFPFTNNHRANMSSEYFCKWNENNENQIATPIITIQISNGYFIFSSEFGGTYAHGYTQEIKVDFTDKYINEIITKFKNDKQNEERLKIELEKDKKSKLIKNL